ncbi:unnamed protein product, partial [Prorocentrum cordatum]
DTAAGLAFRYVLDLSSTRMQVVSEVEAVLVKNLVDLLTKCGDTMGARKHQSILDQKRRAAAAPAVPLQAKVNKAFHDLRQLRERTDKACNVYEKMEAELAVQRSRIQTLTNELKQAEEVHTALVEQLHKEVAPPSVPGPPPAACLDIAAIIQGKAEEIPISIDSLLAPQHDYEIAGDDLEEANRRAQELKQSLQDAVRKLFGDALVRAKAFQADQKKMLE